MSAQSVIRWLAWALTAISFLGSWTHCYERVHAAGQPEPLAVIIATLPEVSVLVALLAWMSGERSVWVSLTGVSAFAFTITANWQTAQAGVWSHAVAVWPAWSAITALMLTHGSTRPEIGAERLSDVSARVSVEVNSRSQRERSAAHSVDLVSGWPLTERSQDQLSAQPLTPPLTPPLTERSQDQAVSVTERLPLTERSQDQLSERDRSQDQLAEHAVSALEMPTERLQLTVDTNTNDEVLETTQDRIRWLRVHGEMKNEDVMKLFSVSAATARRYRQSATLRNDAQ